MRLSECGARLIAEFEGLRLQLYNDPSPGQHCTIGIGHLVHYGPCDGFEPEEFKRGLTEAQAYDLLRSDMEGTYTKAVNAWANARGRMLLQHQMDSLASFTMNLGVGIIGNPNSSLRQALDSHGDVAAAMALYDKAGGQRLPGLTRRRAREGRLWNQAEYGFACEPTRRYRGEDRDEWAGVRI